MSSVYFYEPFFSFNDFNRFYDDLPGAPSRAARPGSPERPSHLPRSLNRDNSPMPVQSQPAGPKAFQPRMDIHESPDHNLIVVSLELPGLNKEDVHIDMQHGNRLIISGETTHGRDLKEDGYIHRERRSGRFSRSLPLPNGTQPTDIKASMENGVLTITFPKTSPEQAPQRIVIN